MLSFHPRKLLSTGDGGMIVTANPEVDARLRLLRQHGMSVPDTVRHASAQVVFEDYPVVGYNYRMTDIQAAIGREQVARLAGIVERRRTLAARYQDGLSAVPGVQTPHEPAWARTNWQSYAVRLTAADQRAVMQRMLDDGVSTRRGVMNVHREASYPGGHVARRRQPDTRRTRPGHGHRAAALPPDDPRRPGLRGGGADARAAVTRSCCRS